MDDPKAMQFHQNSHLDLICQLQMDYHSRLKLNLNQILEFFQIFHHEEMFFFITILPHSFVVIQRHSLPQ